MYTRKEIIAKIKEQRPDLKESSIQSKFSRLLKGGTFINQLKKPYEAKPVLQFGQDYFVEKGNFSYTQSGLEKILKNFKKKIKKVLDLYYKIYYIALSN